MGDQEGPVTIVVVGGAGAMGRITVRDLVETAPQATKIVVADYNEAAARRLARSYKQRPVVACFADVGDRRGMIRLLDGAFAVINCTQHQHNLKVMEAALAASVHYFDLGGLFHVTREQLKLDGQFKKRGLLALLGIGAAPGISNVLARSAADTMDEVHEIHCLVGNIDRTPDRPITPLGASYSMQTILDEASLPAAIFSGGKFQFVEPMSGAEPVQFPQPVGLRRPARTIHSEVATLPLSYKKKGIREVTFRIAFPDELDDSLRFLRAVGLLAEEPIEVGRSEISPRDFLLKVIGRLDRPDSSDIPDEYEILRAVVRGTRAGHHIEDVVDCHVPGLPSWGFGIDADTGSPPSIAVQMLLRGEITERGAVPPERAVPAEAFFKELLRRGMTVRTRTSVGARVVAPEAVAPAAPANGDARPKGQGASAGSNGVSVEALPVEAAEAVEKEAATSSKPRGRRRRP